MGYDSHVTLIKTNNPAKKCYLVGAFTCSITSAFIIVKYTFWPIHDKIFHRYVVATSQILFAISHFRSMPSILDCLRHNIIIGRIVFSFIVLLWLGLCWVTQWDWWMTVWKRLESFPQPLNTQCQDPARCQITVGLTSLNWITFVDLWNDNRNNYNLDLSLQHSYSVKSKGS